MSLSREGGREYHQGSRVPFHHGGTIRCYHQMIIPGTVGTVVLQVIK